MWHERKISSSMLERKVLDFSLNVKSVSETGRFAGYASVFDLVDNQRDIILPGAFRETIQSRTEEVKLLWQHNQYEPIGYFTAMFEDERGLYVEGQLLLEVQRAREALALMKAGVLRGLSIGYSPVRYALDPDTGIRRISAVELWEVSLVTFPANAAANVTVVKQDFPEDAIIIRSGALMKLSDALDRALGALRV